MKKKIMIVFSAVFLMGLFFYFHYIYGWYEFRLYQKTPKEFLNHTKIKEENYSKDSVRIVLKMEGYIKEHKESFYSKEYFDSTKITIDTILYSPDFKKLAIFVIVENPTNRQLVPNKEHKWYYDGYCYIGNKENDSIIINSINIGYRNYSNKKDLFNDLKKLCFLKYASNSDINGNKNIYNLDDIRYWDKSIDWQNLEQRRKSEKEFEEEKIKNPKNISEPK
ncbi:hypothetical protein C8C83_1291 [Flavobacterium sp. 90]|uniref:hypothetical protein n=1 Tax=unclassified Flavobacterium TaxID=196869 RepID=UPI000F207C18|nr:MULTISPECIES: hypothetical protein [unclassified Flavobacterium]RKR09648.1 hypothetical protein C8C82_1592 [Flavobacterium sp. 81]TCK53432.1 hypothetical protein C8C83_1291 [Flavobacterium sp. 90]